MLTTALTALMSQLAAMAWPVSPTGQGTPSIWPPMTVPNDASMPVDPAWLGFAFEMASLTEYAQDANGNRNEFTMNLMDEITSRTGGYPIIRIGGTSGDFGLLLLNQTSPALPVATLFNTQAVGKTTIGPSYWQLTKMFPAGSKYVIQLPLANTNVSEAILWATTSVEAIGWDNIHALEIGNEPDLYPNQFANNSMFQQKLNNETYVGNYTKYEAAINQALNLSNGDPIYQAFDLSHIYTGKNSAVFDPETCYNLGIDKTEQIKTVAYHVYQTSNTPTANLGPGLMNHSAIAALLDAAKPVISYLNTKGPNGSRVPLIISEIGNSLNGAHNYAYQSTMGAALWQVDFQLYCLSIGVAAINWQQIMHSGYDMWLPIDSGNFSAQVYPPYYAQPFLADFIGDTNYNTQVAMLDIVNWTSTDYSGATANASAASNTSSPDNIIAYGSYAWGQLCKVAVVNLNIWNPPSPLYGPNTTAFVTIPPPAERPSTTIDIGGLDDGSKVTWKYLNSPYGASSNATFMTYGGSQWTYASQGKEVTGVWSEGSGVMYPKDGMISVTVEESSAVLLEISK